MKNYKNSGFFWDIFKEICAIVAIFTLVFGVIATIHALNTMTVDSFAEVGIVVLFAFGFWFFSSFIARFG